MPTSRYLISTSGARYRHPDRAAIELILSQSASGPRELYFNYESETTTEWADDSLQEQYDYRPEYPSKGPGITVSLG
jgi:hypothetical protein